MTTSRENGRVFWTAAVLVVALDIVTKALAVRHLDAHVPHDVVGNFVRFTLAYNPGAAFSMSLGRLSRFLFGGIAVIALGVLWYFYATTRPGETARVLALGLAWGGAAGNLIDRIRSPHGVVDFIDIGVGNVRFWTFNVADSGVTIGALLLAFILWREDRAGHAAATKTAAPAPTE